MGGHQAARSYVQTSLPPTVKRDGKIHKMKEATRRGKNNRNHTTVLTCEVALWLFRIGFCQFDYYYYYYYCYYKQ